MYKKTSQAETFRERVASDSTKPLATGVVNVLPPGAQPWEAIFLGLREQIEGTIARLNTVREQLEKVNWKLKDTLPRREFELLVRNRAQLCQKQEHYALLLKELRGLAHKAAANSLAYCFQVSAHKMLTDELFSAVLTEANALSAGNLSREQLPKADPVTSGHGLNRKSFLRNSQTKILHPTSDRSKKLRESDRNWLFYKTG
jgi:hypothetical protein